MLSQNSTSLTVSEKSLATLIGIAAPVDSRSSSSDLTITLTNLPSDGSILLADGITPVYLGQLLTVNQLADLKFRPAPNSFATSSSFGFAVSDPGGRVGRWFSSANDWVRGFVESTGTLLATATFTNETESGWQQVNSTASVVITAGTTYVE